MPMLTASVNTVLEVQTRAIRQEREIFKNTSMQIREKEKCLFFADDMILYTENPKSSTKHY